MIKDNLTILYEDNIAYIVQIKNLNIKGDQIKYISLKFFNTHELPNSYEIDVQKIKLSDNLIN